METIFLACFLFGVIFTLASVVFGLIGSGLHADAHVGHHLPSGHDAGHHLPAGHEGGTPHVNSVGGAQHTGHEFESHQGALPLLNFSSLLGFLTWFGAAGYILVYFTGWAPVLAIPVAALAGLAGAVLIAAFLRKILAGEQELHAADYKLEGVMGRVTVSIPEGGVGEIVFSQAGKRRSEAARSLQGTAIPRESEVVIVDYDRGVAAVQPWEDLLGESRSRRAERALPQKQEGETRE